MKKLILLALLALPFISKASHELGGQVSAKDLGGSQYEVKIKMWVDSTIAVSPSITYAVQNSGMSTSYTAALTSNIPMGNSILEITYMDTIGFNALGAYKIVYTNCCRSMNITNLNSPSTQNLYFETLIQNNPAITNSTPEFVNSPDFFASPNDTLIHNPLAIDPDGDSLVFTWMNPLGFGGTAIPMSFVPYPAGAMSFTVDAVTGEISWIPSMTGVYSYAVKVQEYRNGTLLSTGMRDATVNICVGCKTAMSSDFQFYNMNNWPMVGNYYQFQAYANTAFNYTFNGGVSSINSNSLNMNILGEANYSVNPPVFTASQNMNNISGTYSWTPATNQIRNRPYLNVIIGKETNQLNQNRKKERTLLVKVNAGPTSTGTLANDNKMSIYPNPAHNEIMIELQNRNADNVRLDIYSSLGQRMYHQDLNQKAVEAILVNTTNWASGNYIIHVNGKQPLTQQFMVVK
jgi:hypothetical protein